VLTLDALLLIVCIVYNLLDNDCRLLQNGHVAHPPGTETAAHQPRQVQTTARRFHFFLAAIGTNAAIGAVGIVVIFVGVAVLAELVPPGEFDKTSGQLALLPISDLGRHSLLGVPPVD
jgi:hypothetical protein